MKEQNVKISLSEVCQTLITDLQSPHLENREIAIKIEQHPLIVDEVIRSVNSVRYSLSFEIRSIAHAISILGRTRLVSLLHEVSRTDAEHVGPKAPKFASTPQKADRST